MFSEIKLEKKIKFYRKFDYLGGAANNTINAVIKLGNFFKLDLAFVFRDMPKTFRYPSSTYSTGNVNCIKYLPTTVFQLNILKFS